jgi:hypothetical protein
MRCVPGNGRWCRSTALTPPNPSPVLQFQIEPCERVLVAGVDKLGVWARIWSDARHGGRASSNGSGWRRKRSRRLPPLPLGEHAGAIATLVPADDGFWAVALDSAGAPEHLIHYRQNKHSGEVKVRVHAVATLRAQAVVLDDGEHA